LNDAEQLRIQRVTTVRAVEAVVAVRPTDDETNSTELPKLILNSVKGQPAHIRQLAHVALVPS